MATVKGPDAFRTISEAAAELGVPQHVLRFWETKFSFIRPMKRAGGRRFYRRQDIEVLRGVRSLLHDQGYTIKGVQRLHKEHGVAHVAAAAQEGVAAPPSTDGMEALDPATFEADGYEADRDAGLDAPEFDASDVQGGEFEAGEADTVEALAERQLVLDDDARAHLEAVLEDLEAVKARIDKLLG
jgi:DNA-binding transcriptional MerR regulator